MIDPPPTPMRVIIDYRPALSTRSGVGESVHQLARALRRAYPDDGLVLFTSSWKERPSRDLARAIPGARISDHRVPVTVLNYAWHNVEWPPVETLVGEPCDVAFSPHPLLMPARAAQVVMVHDLDFLKHPERTRREIRRDYPRLAGPHAQRADGVIVPSRFTAREVQDLLQVPSERIAVCPPGLPAWQRTSKRFAPEGYLLFMGTLEPRKNVAGLLAAYARLLARRRAAPKLVLAGHAGEDARDLLDGLARPPLAGHVEYLGYVPDVNREHVYGGARAFVLPSFEEGFGMPALEAMSLGIPVVASDRGALPEVVGDAGLLVDPANHDALAEALERVSRDDALAGVLADRGLARASAYSWERTAADVRRAFAAAIERRAAR